MEREGRYVGGDYAYVSADKAYLLESNQVAPGDIVVTQRGTMGQVSIVPNGYARYVVSQSQMGLHVSDTDRLFVYYALKSRDFVEFVTGATIQTGVPHINLGLLRNWTLRAPLKASERQAIGASLGALDDKIEHNQRTARTLEAIARTLFQSWFVDFDPVRRNVASQSLGLPTSIADLFPTTMTEDLPEGWTIERVGDVFDIVAGNTPSTEQAQFWGDTYAWATPRDLSKLSGSILLNPERGLTEEGLRASSSGLLPAGTLLLSSRAPIGYLAFATRPTAINQGIAAFRRKRVSTSFAWMWCHTNMGLIKASANGSTFLEISKGVLRQLPMVQGPEPVMRAFAEIADPLVSRLVALEEQNATLATLRDTLLPKLISGELRICNAETAAESI